METASSTAVADQPAEAALGADRTASAQAPDAPPESLVSDDELAAARAEVETSGEKIASLDDAPQADAGAAPAPDPAATPSAGRKMKFRIGGPKGAEGADATLAAKQAPPDAARPPRKPPRPTPLWWKRFTRGIENGLDWINAPLGWLPPLARKLTGVIAATTLVTACLAGWLLPIVAPHRDAIDFLREKRAQLDTPDKAPDSPQSASDAQPPAAP